MQLRAFSRYSIALFTAALTLSVWSCKEESKPEETPKTEASKPPVPLISHVVVQAHPHDMQLFTEGLLFHKGRLYESTGSPDNLPNAKSMIGITDIASGKFTAKAELDRSKYFGEGIVVVGDKLYQLTYKNQMGFIYDINTFKQTGTFNYASAEGWGMTTNGQEIIMSDGTDMLTFLNPADLKPVKTLKVTDVGVPLTYINELEFINGYIYANVWMTNFIVKIDPSNGNVVGRLDLSPLAYEARSKNPEADVLNGIAYNPETGKIYVTGKLWPNLYEIKFEH
ncbi:MAG: glutaminyl-peptide cyclotransferase [Chitinophagaceae bacterium]|nr:glutaminyl-peptide cyclotransferase [Chitinophagaceae bacterium]